MNLSHIVSYLNHLDSLDVHDEASEAIRRLDAVRHVVATHDIQVDQLTNELDTNFKSVYDSIDQFKNTLNSLRHELVKQINSQEQKYLENSFKLYDCEMRHDSPEYVLSRQISTDDKCYSALKYRIKNLTDWRLPGMIIGPRRDKIINDMVPMDPLYVVDTHTDLLAPAIRDFTPDYQRRLRQYIVNDYAPGPILNELPAQQFGLIVAYNYFNYRPMEIITRYFREIATKLRPGGSFIMTYNNCDQGHGVALAERSWMCYTPKRLVIRAAQEFGLELVSAVDAVGDLNWLEFRCVGNIETVRGGQCLAKIIDIPQ
jgi:hypothetical protein